MSYPCIPLFIKWFNNNLIAFNCNIYQINKISENFKYSQICINDPKVYPKCLHHREYNVVLEEMYNVYKILFEIQQNDINMKKYFNIVYHITYEFFK